jgi:VIT1/CCC1 family predicted Fe2+/Mn2+ transporter
MTSTKETLSVRVPTDIYNQLEEYCEEAGGLSKSDGTRRVLEEGLDEIQNDDEEIDGARYSSWSGHVLTQAGSTLLAALLVAVVFYVFTPLFESAVALLTLAILTAVVNGAAFIQVGRAQRNTATSE